MKKIITLLCALVFSAAVHAELSSLVVSFTPGAEVFSKGMSVGVSAVSNGVNAQYRFVLLRVVGSGNTVVTQTPWSATNSLAIDTGPESFLTGQYRLNVVAREAANKPELLVKTEMFQVVEASTEIPCESIEGKTYTNVAPAASFSMGDVSLAEALGGVHFTLPAHAGAISSVSFDSGIVSVELVRITSRVCVFICIVADVSDAGAEVTGTYTCSGDTASINVSGMLPMPASPSAFTDLVGGNPVPISIVGPMTIYMPINGLTSGSQSFE